MRELTDTGRAVGGAGIEPRHRPLAGRGGARRPAQSALLLAIGLLLFSSTPGGAQELPLSVLEERAFQQAAAKADPSIVRIETVGGLDVIGESVAPNGPTTGVVVGADGWIITSSFNFLSQPASILVTAGGERYPARLVAKDESRQLTLLKIETSELKPIEPADPATFRVGQWTIALGRTLDPVFPSVSVGILSAVNRISGKAIQTDAKTSPVNYGGPLVDLDGKCLGIIVPMSPDQDEVTAGVDWYDSGIGFAVPLADVLRVLERLKTGETLKPGRLGILYPDKGLLTGEVKIDKVRPRSPAETAGLKPEDVIVGVDGKPVDRAATLKQLLGPKYGGDSVTLAVRRGSETLEKPITLVSEIPPFEVGWLGILPERSAAKDKSAATIRVVLPNSPAAAAGLKGGMVITKVGTRETKNFDDVRSALESESAGSAVTLETLSAGQAATHSVTLGSSPESVPAEIAPREVGSPAAAPATKVGRFVDQIEGDERRFWAYVPEHYNPDFAYGLVVWLHPEADRREASTLERWRSLCDQRGLILVAPPAGDEPWGQADVAYVLGVIAEIQKRYTIDPQRTVLVGEAEGGRLALFLALVKRDMLAGAAVINFPLPKKAPEVDPQNVVRLHVSAFENGSSSAAVTKSVEVFRKEKHPLVLRTWAGDGADGPTAECVEELGRWIDTLDGV